MANRLNEPCSHFISLEVKNDGLLDIFKEKLRAMQEDLAQVPDIGKPTKSGSVHITVATLSIHDQEMETVAGMIDTAVKGYVEMLNSTTGLVVSFQGVGFGDDAVWTNMTLGAASLKVFRELLEDEVEPYLTDRRFTPHLTVYRKCGTTEEMKKGVCAAVKEVKLGCLTIEGITLRGRKTGPEVPEPLRTWSLMGCTTNCGNC